MAVATRATLFGPAGWRRFGENWFWPGFISSLLPASERASIMTPGLFQGIYAGAGKWHETEVIADAV